MGAAKLKARIQNREAVITVIGQGYVGLPLAMAIAQAGYDTYGFDINPDKVAKLEAGNSYITDVQASELQSVLRSGKYRPTNDSSVFADTDIWIICVPTPLNKSKDPDISYIVSAMEQIKAYMHPDCMIILESTTYPGTTDELVVGQLEKQGYRVGEDFFACFSPERVDPGNLRYHTRNTPKIIGGVTPICRELGELLYRQVMQTVIPVSSAKVAEMVKLLENTFRTVNIGLVNEMALMCERMGIDIWEVIDAAATKPFGFMPFYPGPGIGGHCIPLDPMYLAWKAKSFDFYNRFIELASDVNGNMPRHVVSKVVEALNLEGKALNGARVLILGMTYKRDIDDIRESPSLEIYRLLKLQGAHVDFYDPYVPSFVEGQEVVTGIGPLTENKLAIYDCVILATDHQIFSYRWIAENTRLIVDTRHAFRGINLPHIITLGTPTPSLEEWERITAARREAAAGRVAG